MKDIIRHWQVCRHHVLFWDLTLQLDIRQNAKKEVQITLITFNQSAGHPSITNETNSN